MSPGRRGAFPSASRPSAIRLREIFNDPLFVRAGGTMTPTPRALSLAIPVAEVLADIRRNVLAGSAFDPLTDHQVFRVGVSDYAEIAVIRPVLLSLRQQGPGMQVVLEHTDRDRVGAMLEVGAIDLAIGFYPDPQGQMRSEPSSGKTSPAYSILRLAVCSLQSGSMTTCRCRIS